VRTLQACYSKANAPADTHDWVRAVNKLRRELPKDVQETLDKCERDGNPFLESTERPSWCYIIAMLPKWSFYLRR
jgi:hypothetical protein